MWCLVSTETLYNLYSPEDISVGFEEEIAPGVIFFTFTDPKIVVKSLFPILYVGVKDAENWCNSVKHFATLIDSSLTFPEIHP